MEGIAVMTGVLFGLAVLAALVLFIGLFFRHRPGRAGEIRVERLLSRLQAEALHDIVLPDGRGGLTQIDHLVLTDRALLVLETKEYSGTVLGRERESHWTQRLGGKSYRFQNPLRQNYLHLEAVRSAVPGIAVEGHVVFAGTARFPKGMPEGVSTLDGLPDLLVHTYGVQSPNGELIGAWERVKARVLDSPEAREAHLSQVKAQKEARASASGRRGDDSVTASAGPPREARVAPIAPKGPTPSDAGIARPVAVPAEPAVSDCSLEPRPEILDQQLLPEPDLRLPIRINEVGIDPEQPEPPKATAFQDPTVLGQAQSPDTGANGQRLSTSKLAKSLGLRTPKLTERLLAAGFLEDQGGKLRLTEKGKDAGGAFRFSKTFGPYFIWPADIRI